MQLLAILATSPFLGEIVIAEPDVWERYSVRWWKTRKAKVSSGYFEI